MNTSNHKFMIKVTVWNSSIKKIPNNGFVIKKGMNWTEDEEILETFKTLEKK